MKQKVPYHDGGGNGDGHGDGKGGGGGWSAGRGRRETANFKIDTPLQNSQIEY